ncbi:HFD1 [Candida pseudojiufengensis]|uniref:HFD1 n=1 Tax=Candida pseudojiufengensis TaxID=497109 RepID=UPI002225AD56|nr:HFD1 [Candida pseudojiufengensis]KAI5959775.1 HFD1 [Candida pseudojiufengensis]
MSKPSSNNKSKINSASAKPIPKNAKTSNGNGTKNSEKIATPQLEQVESSLSSPSAPSSPVEEPNLSHRVSIKRSSNASSLIDIAEGKNENSSEKKNSTPSKVPTDVASGRANSVKSVHSNGDTASTETLVNKTSDENSKSKPTSQPKPSNTNTDYKYTELKDIPIGVDKIREGFHSGKTHSIQFRLNQIRNLYFAIKDNQLKIIQALSQDFNRVSSETKNYEISTGLNEMLFTMSQLHKWSKPEPVSDLPLNLLTNPVYIERIPLGVVLVIAAFNYPFFVSISPIVGALAAGNTVVFKPSELTPRFSKLFVDILTKALDPDIFFAVNGAVPETTELLNQKVDKIIYTGSGLVGKIIAKKAAETLTPVILELGGKSPAFVLDDVTDKDLTVIARRIAWGRFANAGQTCIGVDYVYVAESKHEKFVTELRKVITEEFYPNVNKNDKNFTHLIHDRAFEKMSKIISNTKGNIIVGGESDAETRYFAPTVVDNVTWEDSTMQDEIFGPILPILTYKNLNEACHKIIQNFDTPLALYIFTSKSTSPSTNPQIKTITTSIRSGGLIINDVLMHIALHNAPFGGVGTSGYGSYHGKYSYRAFTHERTVIEQKFWNDSILAARYPPFSNSKDKLVKSSQELYGGRVWFGRKGNVNVDGPSTFFSGWTNALGLVNIVKDFVGVALS